MAPIFGVANNPASIGSFDVAFGSYIKRNPLVAFCAKVLNSLIPIVGLNAAL